MAAVASPEQQLAWEARQRPRAAAAAIVAGIAAPLSLVLYRLAIADVPKTGFLTALGQAFEAGPVGEKPSHLVPVFEYFVDRPLVFVGTAVLQAIAMVGLAWAVTFLAVAARARRPELPKYLIYVTLIGATLVGIAALLNGIGSVLAFNGFLDGAGQTVDDARDTASQPLLATAILLGELAPLALAAGLLLVSLNAMRVGLLTRFLGILGMISGGLTVFASVFLFAPFVQAFWLLSVGFLFLTVTRPGSPPAWRTGRAEPWPSQREVAAARQAARRPAAEPASEPEPQPVPAGRPHPSSKKRKRKRRG